MVEVPLERPASDGGDRVPRSWHPPLERLRATDVVGFLELARVDAQIPIGRAVQLFEVVERQTLVHGQGAHDAETQTLVNQPVERERSLIRRLAAHGCELRFLLRGLRAFCPSASPSWLRLTHRASLRSIRRSRCAVRRTT